MSLSSRVTAVRNLLDHEALGAFVLTDPANIAYVTGFRGVFGDDPAHAAIISKNALLVYTDSRYAEAASSAAVDTAWEVRIVVGDVLGHVSADLNRDGVSSLAFENSLSHRRYAAMETDFEGICLPSDGWVEGVRALKDAAEIGRIVAAQGLTDAAFDHILGFVAVGVSESRIALELEFFMRTNGSDGVAFAPIVASGPNSALPHAHPGPRTIARGDFLKMDFGARVGGYCSDMTRTIVIGPASDRQREIYDTVLAANLAGIAAVRPGLLGKEIDAAARAVIDAAGYAANFGHGLGHGVGLEVHEQPGLGPRSERPVPLGSVVTIEPGIYIPGFGGVRIEDLVVVEQAGARVLTRSTKELIEL